MLLSLQPSTLLISRDPTLIAAVQPVLHQAGMAGSIAFSPKLALSEFTTPRPPCLVFYDIDAAGNDGESAFCHWLTEARAAAHGHIVPIVLFADSANEEWMNCLADGALDDLIPRSVASPFWRVRLTLVLRTWQRLRELERLRESTAIDAKLDKLTGIYNRASLLSTLFRETDRVQRLKSPLSLILFDLDAFGPLNERLGPSACDDLLCQVASRTNRLLRSYDIFGRTGHDEFLLILPGCGTADAQLLCERLRLEVFSSPFILGDQNVCLSACFGIAPSQGRSPIVVLRAAEDALVFAKHIGVESIHCAGSSAPGQNSTADFLSNSSGQEILAW